MDTLFDETAPAYPTLYYRWQDERSPLVVEIKMELVPRILVDLEAAEEMGLEGGGVLVGCFPKSIGPPLLRIEEFESVGRRSGDGLPYILSTEQRQRFTIARKKATTPELSPVGYFRSHMRTGAFELSIGDRDLMSTEFRNSLHVALLIGRDQSGAPTPEKARHLATYFVSVHGVIQNRVDPMTFPFEVEDLQKLAIAHPRLPLESRPVAASREALTAPEQPPAELPFIARTERAVERESNGSGGLARRFAWTVVGLLALLTVAFAVWGWNFPQGTLPWSPTRLELSAATQGSTTAGNQSVHVTWNHGSPLLASATKAVLTISDHATHRTIQEFELSPSDLTAGSVKLDLAAIPVDISLVLFMADSTRVTQVAEPRS